MKRIFKIKAESSLEFAIITACVVAALVGMGLYVKNRIQGRLRWTADEIGPLYAPQETTGTSSKTLNRQTHTEVYTQEGTEELPPGSGKIVEGKHTFRRDDILSEIIQEDVNEEVK